MNSAEITIKTGGTGTIFDLTLEVVDNVEKRTMEGNSLMRVGVKITRGKETGEISFYSPGQDEASWGGYRFRYRGGWRSEVVMLVEKEGAGAEPAKKP